MKKKLLIFLFLILFISGCGTKTTPKGEVQKLFLNYNSLSSDLLIQLDNVMSTENLNEAQKNEYKDILKKQYEDLKYKIKDEVIDNDKAVVTVEIEVYNLRKSIDNADNYLENNRDEFNVNNVFSNEKFWDYKLEQIKNENERVNYILELSLTKIDKNWHLDNLLETDREKIHGLYK